MLETLLQDVRYGFRTLFKYPGFIVVALLVLALGIGANTAIFSIVHSILLRPLPYKESDRLVMITERSPRMEQMSVSYMNFLDWKTQAQSFEQMAIYRWEGLDLTGIDQPERLDSYQVSVGFFEALGVIPLHGRTIQSADDRPGAPPVVVLGYDLWQRQFNADPAIINKSITLSGQSWTVIGVTPPGFRRFPRIAQLWTPIGLSAARLSDRGVHSGTTVIARLKPGVTIERARSEMSTIASRLERQYQDTNRELGATVSLLNEMITRNARPALLMLFGAVGFVLLIACTNVANLLLVRASSRRKEISIRAALGASRKRLIRQFFTESVLLALMGGVLGFFAALWGVNSIKSAIPPNSNIPRVSEIGIDSTTLLFTLGISLITGIIFGVAPALRGAQTDLNEVLKEGNRNRSMGARLSNLHNLLVIGEVALALTLLIGAGLLFKGLRQLLQVDPGFKAENVVTMAMSPPQFRYDNMQKHIAFYDQFLARLRSLPGVESAAIVNPLPLGGASNQAASLPDNRLPKRENLVTTDYLTISPGYFKTMGIMMMKGREFDDRDRETSDKVVIIDEKVVEAFWPGENPIGRRLAFEITGSPSSPNPIWREIVGVVKNVKHYSLGSNARQQIYVPYLQLPNHYQGNMPPMQVVVKTDLDAGGLVAAIRNEIKTLDPNLPVYDIDTMEQIVNNTMAQSRLVAWLMGIFATLALILAAVGLYGVMSFFVNHRTHEIGIRMALGAGRSSVLGMILKQGLILTLIGLVAGLVFSFLLIPLIVSRFYGIGTIDPLTVVGISTLLVVVALIASYLPARKATKVDPLDALRYE